MAVGCAWGASAIHSPGSSDPNVCIFGGVLCVGGNAKLWRYGVRYGSMACVGESGKLWRYGDVEAWFANGVAVKWQVWRYRVRGGQVPSYGGMLTWR